MVRRMKFRSCFKTAFVTGTSEIYSRKAEVRNRRRPNRSYIENEFWADNDASENCSRSQRKLSFKTASEKTIVKGPAPRPVCILLLACIVSSVPAVSEEFTCATAQYRRLRKRPGRLPHLSHSRPSGHEKRNPAGILRGTQSKQVR
jgi:hypothetical protein